MPIFKFVLTYLNNAFIKLLQQEIFTVVGPRVCFPQHKNIVQTTNLYTPFSCNLTQFRFSNLY